MAVQTRTYSSTTDVVAGATILAQHINTDLDKLYTLQNGAIDNANISASAAIVGSKLDLTSGTTNIYATAGNVVREYGSGGVKYLEQKHDDTNGIITSSSGNVQLVPAGGFVDIAKASTLVKLRLYDNAASPTNNITLWHDGTNGNLVCSAGSLFFQQTLAPQNDNSYAFGGGSNRWTAIYAVNGTIQTSFLKEKNVLNWHENTDFLAQLPRVIDFTWKEGDDKPHLGIVGDDLPAIATAGDDKNIETMGVVALAIGAIKQLKSEKDALEVRVKALEEKLAA